MKWFDDTLQKAEQFTLQNHSVYLQKYITRRWIIEKGCGVEIFYFIYDNNHTVKYIYNSINN